MAVERDASGVRVFFREIRKIAGTDEVETTKVYPPIECLYANWSAANLEEAKGYGAEVKLTRQAALSRDARTGKPAPVSEKYAAVAELAAHLNSGAESWTLASSGTSLSADVRDLVNAVAAAFNIDVDAAEEGVRGMTTTERAALRVDPEVKSHLDAIVAARGGAADVAGLKDKLRAMRG